MSATRIAPTRIAEGSAIRTGLSHAALSLAVFGTLGAGAVGATFLFGDESAAAPRVELALYYEQNGPPPLLKNRSPLEALDANAAKPTLVSSTRTNPCSTAKAAMASNRR